MKHAFSCTRTAARAAFIAVLTFASFGLAAGVALASPTGVGSLAFDNGEPLSGFFSYDAASSSITNWDMTSDAFAAHHYQPGVDGGSSFVSSNSSDDEVLSFFQNFSGETFEVDIVLACNGNANCINAGTLTTSFAIVGGHVTCPPGTLKCVSSDEQRVSGFGTHFLLSGFLNLSDPPEGGLSFNIDSSIAPGHTLYGSAPEPSTWAMMLIGFAGLGYAGYRRAREPRAA
jgi:hypothetical protein